MDSNLKIKLLNLIEELRFPLLSEEVEEHLERLSDEQVAKLISLYEAYRDMRDDIANRAKAANLQKYGQVQEKFLEAEFDLRDDNSKKVENVEDKFNHKFEIM